MFKIQLRRLAEQLIIEEQFDKAEVILDLAVTKFPVKYYKPYSDMQYELVEPFADLYYAINKKDKATSLAVELFTKSEEKLLFYKGMKAAEQNKYGYEIIESFNTAYRIIDNCELHKDTVTVVALNKRILPYEKYFQRYLNAYEQQKQEQLEYERYMKKQEQESLKDSVFE